MSEDKELEERVGKKLRPPRADPEEVMSIGMELMKKQFEEMARAKSEPPRRLYKNPFFMKDVIQVAMLSLIALALFLIYARLSS